MQEKKGGSWVSSLPQRGSAIRPLAGNAGRTGLVFGVPLDALFNKDKQKRSYLKVPLFVYKAIKYLTTNGLDKPGILRHAGSGPEVQRYQNIIDSGGEIKLKGVEDVNTVSSLLKNFLRQLPEPLLTSALYREWIGLPELRDIVLCVQKVNELVHRLPPANRAVLSELIKLLYQIDQASEMSKMDAGGLSSLMAKNLLWKEGESEENLEITVKLNDIVKMMILEYPLLFESEEAEHASAKPEPAKFARFLRKLVGHKKSVSCIAPTWDGKHIWSGDSEGQISIWSVDDIKLVQSIAASSTLFAITRVQNNMWCASGESLQIRDDKGKLVQEIPGRCFCIHQVDATSVWVGCEGRIKIWDLRRMECKKEIPVAPAVLSLTFDGTYVWGGCNDKKLRVWNAKTHTVEKEIEAHARKVNCVHFSNRYVWSSSDDKTVALWNPKTFEKVKTLEAHTGYVYGLTGMGDRVWSCSWDKSIRLWDTEGNSVGRLLNYHYDGVSAVSAVYSHRRRAWLAWSASFDRTLSVWLVTNEGCSLAPPVQQVQQEGTVSVRADGIFQGEASVMVPTESIMVGGASVVSTSMRDYSFDPAKRDPTGLQRWEIDPSFIKNPGNSLGTGSFGTVFKAELHGKEVAVKKLSTQKFDEKTLEEFRKEVAIMSTLRHPNVLLFMGACTQPGNLLIVTELMPRGSVYDLLRDPKVSLTFKRKMQFAKDAALGVNWLHRSKPQFLHLDLKAANLLVDINWTVKVADFGLSVVKQDAASKKERHGPIGTPLWMAPEVLMNKPYDEKADVYSFAIVLWEILSAADPWQEIESLVDLVDAVCLEHKRPQLPKDVVPSLRDLINGCWLPSPDSRPSFEEIVPRFDTIIIDGLISDPVGRSFWSENFLGKLTVPYPEFLSSFVPSMKLPTPTGPTDIKYQCLREVVAQGTEKDKVTMEGFSKMLSWFGPLSEPGLLDRIYDLLKKPFFHGEISSTEAEKLIAGEKKGTFLLRFSNRDPGCYALTVQAAKGGLKHYRIQHTPGGRYAIGKVECSSLDSLIKRYHTELSLKRPCPGSKYEAMFHAFEKNVASLGYQDVDL